MTRGLIFWVLMLIWFVFAILPAFGVSTPLVIHAGQVLEFILFVLLGWQVYGPPVHG